MRKWTINRDLQRKKKDSNFAFKLTDLCVLRVCCDVCNRLPVRRLDRRGYGRHGSRCQHFCCSSHSVCQSGAAKGRTGCLNKKLFYIRVSQHQLCWHFGLEAVLSWKTVLDFVGRLVAFLTCTHHPLATRYRQDLSSDNQKVSRHCQISPGRSNNLRLRTTVLHVLLLTRCFI